MTHSNLQDGEALGGQYRLTERIAEDEAGSSWRGADERTGREVLLRVLRPEALGPDATALPGRLAGLRHESIVPPVAWNLEHSPPHVVYEGVEGEPLSAFLADGPIPWDSACEIAAQVLDALAHIHEHGLAYGALRPQAVWVGGDNRVLLGDMGLNAALAPQPGADQGPGGDLAMLGAFLHSLVTGSEAPCETTPAGAGVPAAVADFVARCRGRDGVSSFADAREAHDALRAMMRRELSEAPVCGPSEAPVEPAAPPPEPAAAPAEEDAGDGCAMLERIAGMKGRAMLRRDDTASRLTIAIFVVGCAIGFGLLWWIVGSYLRTVPLTDTSRSVLTYLALVAYAGLGVWVATALLLTRVRMACYAVISDREVLCHDETRGLVMACLSAADIESISLVSFDEKAPEQTVVDIKMRGGGRCRLDFAARAREGGGRGMGA